MGTTGEDIKSKFQQLLRELFQFDCADLDFGIYRIMNYKRAAIERFISEDLPKAIDDELKQGALAEQAQAAKDLEDARKKVLEALTALQGKKRRADGSTISLFEHHLRQYTRRNTSDFFIHKDLRGFLQRELDFYLKNEVLKLDEMEAAGEELAEGWFQLLRLIKKVGGHIIGFLAQIEDFQKMLWEKRKFITETFYVITLGNIPEEFYPEIATCEAQWAEWKALGFLENAEAAGNAVVPGKAVVPTASEVSHKGWHTRGYLPHFDASHVLQFITFRLHDSVPAEVIQQWKTELHWTEQTKPDSKEAVELRKRIERYEDSGYGGCYLRDERIADLVVQALKHFDGERYRLLAWCVMPNHVHVLIAQMPGHSLSKVIHSWKSYTAHEANKLLGRTGDFWMPEYFDRFIRDQEHFNAVIEYIHQNPVKAGLVADAESWPWSSAAVYASVSDADTGTGGRDVREPIREPVREPRLAYLKTHPSLPLDTRHFAPDFTDRLLASFENLDEMTDGLLVHSENWQALNLLMEKYRERVKCIYIDPPYNTGQDEFLYRDNYQHSFWLSMLVNRLKAATSWLQQDGAIFTSIDDHEQANLRKLFESVFGPENFANNVIWQKKYSPQNDARWLSDNHDFLLCFARDKENWKPGLLPRTEEQNVRYQNPDNDPRGPWKPSGLDVKTYSPEYDYEITTPSGRVVRPPKGACWRVSKERFQELVADNRIWFGLEGNNVPAIKRFLSDVKQGITPLTLWTYQEVGHNQEGAQELKAMMRAGDVFFASPKPTRLLKRVITIGADKQSTVLDYFAGSGTTGHAVINLNREDGGRRKFILVEMADYFDTVLLPRIKKVTFSPEWKDGKPNRKATPEEAERGPRIVKVIRLESYEDALNNLAFDESSGQLALQLEDYLLQYMLRWETRKSETLLNVEKLQNPFSYQLHLHRDGETRAQPVDLPETFNYLIGLNVEKRQVYPHPGMASVPDARSAESGRDVHRPGYLVYRGVTREGRRAAVIWREAAGWTEEDYRRDRDFVAAHNLTDGADEIFVNGDSLIPGARALEGVFKARMFAGVEG